MVTFSLVITCVIRGIKEKIVHRQLYGGSTLSLLGSIVGISTLYLCGLSGPLCLTGLGIGLLSALIPSGISLFMVQHASTLLVLAILSHVIALRYMGCFNQCEGHSCQQ
jgi:hypothetical protein